MHERPNISLFFPVYNDEHTVRTITLKAIRILDEIAENYEIIIIDDGSPDNSGEIADALSKEFEWVKVIHHPENLGYGAAIKTGLQNVQYEYVCFTDGDDEYDISDVKKFMKLKDYYDLIITFRYVRMYSTWRIFISRSYNMLLRFLFKTTYRDISTGLRMIRKSVISEIDLISTSPFIGAELTIKMMLKGYRIGELGIQTFPRVFGKGQSVSFANILKTIYDLKRVHRQIFSSTYELPTERKRNAEK
jgi:glycosyltransferase involved in cell wall biosynthesis